MHLSLLKQFPLFIWLLFLQTVSLQCLISALTQVSRRGLLFRFACSVVLWRGRGTEDKYHFHVWEHSQCSSHTGFAPAHGICAIPSTLLRLQVALQEAGPESRALPRPKLLRFRFLDTPQKCRLSWACVLCLPRPEQLRQPGAWQVHSPWVQCTLSPPQFQPQFPGMQVRWTLCLSWEADFWLRPSRWMSTIQNLRMSLVRGWNPICSLVGDAVSGAEFAPFPSPLPPASGGGWAGPQRLVLLWYSLSPLFWEGSGSA